MTANPFSNFQFKLDDHTYCIAKISPDAWEPGSNEFKGCQTEFFSVTRTMEEVSLVCSQSPQTSSSLKKLGATVERDWRLLQIVGQLEFEMVGVIAFFSSLFAKEDIPIFCLSTFDTDYFLVKSRNLESTLDVLDQNKIRWVK